MSSVWRYLSQPHVVIYSLHLRSSSRRFLCVNSTKAYILANDQEATWENLRQQSIETLGLVENSQEDLAGWNNSPFSGLLPGSSADMPLFRAFRVVKHLMG